MVVGGPNVPLCGSNSKVDQNSSRCRIVVRDLRGGTKPLGTPNPNTFKESSGSVVEVEVKCHAELNQNWDWVGGGANLEGTKNSTTDPTSNLFDWTGRLRKNWCSTKHEGGVRRAKTQTFGGEGH